MNPASQCDMLVRLERFKVQANDYWEHVKQVYQKDNKAQFMPQLYEFSKNPLLVSLVASLLHTVDEINWGLINENQGKKNSSPPNEDVTFTVEYRKTARLQCTAEGG